MLHWMCDVWNVLIHLENVLTLQKGKVPGVCPVWFVEKRCKEVQRGTSMYPTSTWFRRVDREVTVLQHRSQSFSHPGIYQYLVLHQYKYIPVLRKPGKIFIHQFTIFFKFEIHSNIDIDKHNKVPHSCSPLTVWSMSIWNRFELPTVRTNSITRKTQNQRGWSLMIVSFHLIGIQV